MKKIAVFVEGKTEQVFVERLFVEVAGEKNIAIETVRASGGRSGSRRMTLLKAASVDKAKRYFTVIVDCGGDSRVKSDIRDRYDGLVKAGYEAIIGIRDAYPDVSREDVPKLLEGLRYKLRTSPVEVLFVVAIMEIEAWFIAEHTHFERMDKTLTVSRIKAEVGVDPANDDVEALDSPADDLHKMYSTVGLAYRKTGRHVERTVQQLDYAAVYLELPERVGALRTLVLALDAFLGPTISA